ncbi:MAG: MarR family transcriptional regulator [Promethearchaeota archaeon]
MARKVQKTILQILENNPNKWISTNDILEVTGFIRQSINNALRNLEKKELVKREKRKQEATGLKMNYVKLNTKKYRDYKSKKYDDN